MIVLKKIKLNNFLSHPNTVLDVNDNQQFLLDGKSGSGKSSIVDALIWGLYGKGRVSNRSLIKKGEKTASVSVSLSFQGDKKSEICLYNITRNITDTGKHDLLVVKKVGNKQFLPVEASGLKDLQDYIEKQILHSSYLLFVNSIVYPQDNVDNFVKQTASRRKEIILEIVNASDYDEYYQKAKDKFKELEIKLEIFSSDIESKREVIKNLENSYSPVEEMEKKLAEYKVDKEYSSTELEKKSIKLSNNKSLIDDSIKRGVEISKISFTIDSLNKEIEEMKTQQAKYRDFNYEILKEKIVKNKEKLLELDLLEEKKIKWTENMLILVRNSPVDQDYEEIEKRINKQIIDLMSKNIEECPEIKKPCPIIERERDARIRDFTETLERVSKEKNEYIIKKTEYNKNVEELGDCPVIVAGEKSKLKITIESDESILDNAEKNINNMLLDISVKKKEIEISENKIIDIKKELSNIEEHQKSLYKVEAEVEVLKKLIQDLDEKISEVSLDISVNKMKKETIENTDKELKVMEESVRNIKYLSESMKMLKEAFGNNGIKAIIIDYVIPRLEDKINEILTKLSDFRVKLDTQRTGMNEDKMIEGLFIDIINDNGEILDFDNYSGGERMKINMAIFEALASLSHINFRIFDETFFALDQESSDNFLEVIKEIRKNVNQFICISHMQNIKDFFIEKVNVIKINGNSKII